MVNMKVKMTIEFNWRAVGEHEGLEITEEHRDALEESAMERIYDMSGQGFTSGELLDNIFMTDDDDDGISYQGSWSITKSHTEVSP